MERSVVAALTPRPEGLPEWEDLLVRFEIMGRALRVTLEEAGQEPARAAAILRGMVRDEAEFAGWLQRARGYDAETDAAAAANQNGAPANPRALADRFTSLRARNFAMLQRRGVDVWEWSGPLGEGEVVTAYQMVTARVRGDAAALEALREGLRLGAAAC